MSLPAAATSPESSSQSAPAEVDPAAFKGRGWALFFLFFAEMWERFSYYGMRALLVLYLVNYLQWQPGDASSLYKWYTSLVYLTPLFGGYLADRYIGLRWGILVGGGLMAIGHFLMAFEPLPFLYAALAFLILGNGFFKPNMSTIVGKMYTPNDPGRDGAFTIFYMGINAGALLCGPVVSYLRVNYGWHYGFAAAGIGMVVGLLFFVFGQKLVLKFVHLAGNDLKAKSHSDSSGHTTTDKEPDENEAGADGVAGMISKYFPMFLLGAAALFLGTYVVDFATGKASFTAIIMPTAFFGVALWMALTLRSIGGKSRDKSTAIFVFFLFSVLFWMAFEQAGNSLTIWADANTVQSKIAGIDLTAEWYQSINPTAIVLLAPVFAWLWVFLAKKAGGVPTAVKMFLAMALITASFVVMVFAAIAENQTVTTAPLESLPQGVQLEKLHAGRLSYDANKKELVARGVFPNFVVNEALGGTVDANYKATVDKLDTAAKEATPEKPVTFKLEALPADYKFPLAVDGKVVKEYDEATQTVTLIGVIDPPSKAKLVGAGAPTGWRTAIEQIAAKSDGGRVTGFWLFLSYLLATLGELCLSPVGLSMVTKLAPVRFSALFMGVWLLSSSVAQYMGGTLGEMWGAVTPTDYFMIFVWTSLAGCILLGLLIKPLRRLMHNVQ